MKKFALFTLAALCVSAAQAITWSPYGTGLAAGSYELDSSKTANGVSIALVVDLDAIPSQTLNGVMGILTDTYSGFMSAGLSYGAINMWRSWTADGTVSTGYGAKEGSTSFKVGENIFGMSIYEGTYNNSQCVKIDYFINDVLIKSDDTGVRWSNQSITNLDELIIGSVADGADVYIAYGTGATAEEFAAVPEPTALALLALGVAGLALKRKHA